MSDKKPDCACTSNGGFMSCEDKKKVFTKREEEVLRKIREASLQARTIKDIMRDLAHQGVGFEEQQRELEKLKLLRDELEKERLAAAEERMRLLGHTT